jgi:hypothetical protein
MLNALVALHAAVNAPIKLRDWRKAVEDMGGILDGEKQTQWKQWTRAVSYMAKANTITLSGKISGPADNRLAVPNANSSAISDDFNDEGDAADDFKDDATE